MAAIGSPRVKRALWVALPLAVAVAVTLVWLRPARVTVAEVAMRELAPAVHGVGTVEAKLVVQVSAKLTARLTAVLVDQGDHVVAGQVVARLDDGQPRAEVSRSEAALATARAQEIEEAREHLRSAAATRALTARDLGRTEELHRRELIAAQELDRARQAHAVAVGQEGALTQSLALVLEGPRRQQIEAARAQQRAAQDRLALVRAGPRAHQVEAARAQEREAEAALARARSRLDDTVLKLADPRTAWVTVHVDERESGALAPGDAATIALRSFPGRPFQGRVVRLRRESDRVTEQLALDVAFVEAPPRLTIGEQAEATIRVSARRALAMPVAALVRDAAGPGALAVVDGRLAFRPVRIGLTDTAGWAEVLGGLEPGAHVVVAPGRLADPVHRGRVVVTRSGDEGAPAASPR